MFRPEYRVSSRAYRSAFWATVLLGAEIICYPALGQAQQFPATPPSETVPSKQEESAQEMRANPGAYISSSARLRALEEFARMEAQRKLIKNSSDVPVLTSLSNWSLIGPERINFPVNNWGYISGWITALAVDPRNADVIYAGAAGGGVWKSTNGGQNWTPLTDNQPSLAVGSLALDPSNPDIVYVGTGSWQNHAPENYFGVGILKSTDGGATWTHLPGPFVGPITSSQAGANILSLAVSPTNGQALLAAVYGGGSVAFGIWRSNDGGTSWTSVLSQALGTTVLFDPQDGNIAYAALSFGLSATNGIYKSSDAGLTWTRLNGAIGKGLPTINLGFVALAISPSSPSTLYAGIADDSTSSYTLLGFFKTVDGGLTWVQMENTPDYCAPNRCGSRHFIRVHPTNPNVVFAGGNGGFQPIGPPYTPIWRTLDGGTTWKEISVGANQVTVFPDPTSVAFSQDGTKLYFGSDGGVFSTTDVLADSINWLNLNSNLAITSFSPGLSIHPTDVNIGFAGATEGGTVRYAGVLDWSGTTCGDGAQTTIDPTNPNTVYASCLGGRSPRKTITSGKSDSSWAVVQNGINASDRVVTFPPLVMDPTRSQTLYFGTDRVYQSTSGASVWAAISPDLAGGTDAVSAIAVAPSDSNTVYAGTSNGNLYVTTNAGNGTSAIWANRSAGLPARWVTQVAVDAGTPLTAYVTVTGFSGFSGDTKGHVFKTNDGGLSWADMSGNLPNIPVNDFVIDPDVPNAFYVATDIGVLVTVDGGVTWSPVGSGLPRVPVTGLKLNRPTRTLRAGTWGRSMWDIWAPAPRQVRVTIAASTPGALFSLEDGTTFQAPATLSWYPGASHIVTWLSSSPTQPGARYIFKSWMDSGSNPRTIVVPSSGGTYMATVTAQYEIIFTSSPTGAGTLTISPASADGFYDAGTKVQVTPIAAFGYDFGSFGGDLSGNTIPQTVTMASPYLVTANFFCHYRAPYPPTVGPGPTSAMIPIVVGPACVWSVGGSTAWFSVGSPNRGTGTGYVPFAIQPNTGTSRTISLPVSDSQSPGFTVVIAQEDSSSPRPSLVSLAPSSGAGSAQVFTMRFSSNSGYQAVDSATLLFDTIPSGNKCQVTFAESNLHYELNLLGDDGSSSLGPIEVPGTGKLQNSRCEVDAAHSAISGSGNILTVRLSLTFFAAYEGEKVIFAYAYSSVSQIGSFQTAGGTWTIPGNSPVISESGVVSAAANVPGVSPGAWISIYGQNLALTSADWTGHINGNTLPTSLDGVTVSIDNKLAAISFVSPTQINAQVPDDGRTGPIQVVVKNVYGTSAGQTANISTFAPSFFTFDGTHIAAQHTDYSPLGSDTVAPGATPGKPGETVLLYSTGFGPTNPPTPTGQVVSSVNPLQAPTSLEVVIGGVTTVVSFAGISAAGLYQFNVVIPDSLPDGDATVVAMIGGRTTQPGTSITIKQ